MATPRLSHDAILVRTFQPGDGDAFRLLNEEWIREYFSFEEKDRKMLSHPRLTIDAGGQILFAVRDGEPIGCCALIAMGDGCFEVSKMAVTKAYRGKGIGRILLTKLIEYARTTGARRLYLETNSKLTPAITLYESLGFKRMRPERITPSLYERTDTYMELFL